MRIRYSTLANYVRICESHDTLQTCTHALDFYVVVSTPFYNGPLLFATTRGGAGCWWQFLLNDTFLEFPCTNWFD